MSQECDSWLIDVQNLEPGFHHTGGFCDTTSGSYRNSGGNLL